MLRSDWMVQMSLLQTDSSGYGSRVCNNGAKKCELNSLITAEVTAVYLTVVSEINVKTLWE